MPTELVIPLAARALAAFTLAALAGIAWALIRWRPETAGRVLLGALAGEALWSAFAAWVVSAGLDPPRWIAVGQAARDCVWALCLLGLVPRPGGADALRLRTDFIRPLGLAAVLGLSMAVAATLGAGVRVVAGFQIALSILLCVSAELLWRRSRQPAPDGLRYLCVAVIALFALDFVIGSDLVLQGVLNPGWLVVRAAVALAALPLLLAAVRHSSDWTSRVVPSRRLVVHSVALACAGIYLIVATLVTRLLQRGVGNDRAELIGTLALSLAIFGLGLLAASRRTRARLRVWTQKHLFRRRFDYREQWSALTRQLEEQAAVAPDALQAEPLEWRALRAVALSIESPSALLWLPGGPGRESVIECSAGWNRRTATLTLRADDPLPAWLRRTGWIVDVAQWRAAPATYDDLVMPAGLLAVPGVDLLVPVALPSGACGFIALARPPGGIELDWEVRDMLKLAARQVAAFLALKRNTEALVDARRFESFSRTSTYVVHDLKNLAAQLSLLLQNAGRHIDKPAFQQDLLETLGHVASRLQSLVREVREPVRTVPTERVPIAVVLDRVLAAARGRRPVPRIGADSRPRRGEVLADAEQLARVLGHVVQNAQEAAGEEGSVDLSVELHPERVVVEIVDDGHGMSESFIRDRLFRPFHSTKADGMGIGMFESRQYLREVGGEIVVRSREGEGTRVAVSLPRIDREGA